MRNKHAFCQNPPVARAGFVPNRARSISGSACTSRLGVNIPEADYARLLTLNNLLDYLQAKLNAG